METESRLSLYGEIDMANAAVIHLELSRALETCRGDVALDCSALTFMDSTALTMLVRLRNEMLSDRRRLRLVNLTGSPRTVVAITGLGEALGVE